MESRDKLSRFLENLLKNGFKGENAAYLSEHFRPEDIVDILNNLDDEVIVEIFDSLSREVRGEVLSLASPALQTILSEHIINTYTPGSLADIIRELNDDDFTDIIMGFPVNWREAVLLSLPLKERLDIKKLMSYPEDSAGGIMTKEYFSITGNIPVKDVKGKLKETADIESLIYIYVLDPEGGLDGVLSLHDLLLSYDNELVWDIMNLDVISASAYTDQEDAARIVEKYDLMALPVTDDNKRMIGVITVDDIIDVIREEQTEDLYRTVGTAEDEIYTNNIISVAKLRLPWLITTFFGSMLSAGLLSLFNRTLHEIIVLTSFVPVITAMGGNIGTQTSTIVVRGLSMGYININKLKDTVIRELGVASLMGLIVGVIISIISYLWHGNLMLGLILGTSMISAVTVAAAIGTLAPFAFKKMNIDPAISSGPLVTTANDATGILIYLGLATILIEYLR